MNQKSVRADDDVEYVWAPMPWGFGTAGGIDSFAAPRDVVAELHSVVEEVTGKPVARPGRRIGFLSEDSKCS